MSLIKGFSAYAVGAVTTFIVGFATTPVITRLVNPDEMGEYSLFVTVATIAATVLYLGLDQSYARYYSKIGEDERPQLLSFCVALPLTFSVIVIVACIPFSDWITSSLVSFPTPKIYLLLAIYLFNMVLNRFLIVDIRMRQKACLYSILNCLRKLAYFILALAFYYLLSGDDSLTLIAAITGAEVVFLIMSLTSVLSNYRNARWFDWDGLEKHDIIMFGLPFILSASVDELFQSADKLLLGAMSNYYEVGIYTAAYSIVAIVGILRTTFSSFWLPVAYERFESNPNDLAFFEKVNQVVTAFMVVLTATLVLFKDIVVKFLGEDYVHATSVFPLLLFVPLMFTMSEVTMTGINLAGKTKYHAIISMTCLVFNVAGNVLLIPCLGATGSALSTAVTYVLFYVLRSFYANKCFRIPYSYRKTALVVCLLSVFVGYSVFSRTNLVTIVLFLLVIAVVLFCYRGILVRFLKSSLDELKGMLP